MCFFMLQRHFRIPHTPSWRDSLSVASETYLIAVRPVGQSECIVIEQIASSSAVSDRIMKFNKFV